MGGYREMWNECKIKTFWERIWEKQTNMSAFGEEAFYWKSLTKHSLNDSVLI